MDNILWQFVPVTPGQQLQLYLFLKLWHVPPFWHGLLAHSLIS